VFSIGLTVQIQQFDICARIFVLSSVKAICHELCHGLTISKNKSHIVVIVVVEYDLLYPCVPRDISVSSLT